MKEMQDLQVTILLASCNRASYIIETLKSIKNQTYPHWVCYITDDNSTDETPEVVADFIKNDDRFSFYTKPDTYNKGLSGTRNFGLDLARENGAHLIQFFDDDDIMYSEKLELQVKPFRKNRTLNFTVCKYDKIIQMNGDETTTASPELRLHHDHIGDAILTGNFKMNSLSGLWNMDLIDKFRFDERLRYAEEWELFIRIGYEYPDNYEVVDHFLFGYRKHPSTLTMGEDEDYERRKSSSVSRLILVNYLTKNNLHTKKSIIFFTRSFLTYQYNPAIVRTLLAYVENNRDLGTGLIYFIKIGLFLSRLHYKILGKISTWV
ncbi:glycosyltransferase family 2 protein [Gramella sp. KN1008]|uniref:glycosyltransferase family 2 protein n=1 Tax=Gramella sp. KN1008 TaxID=2529298 RepID=UPI00103AB2E0|nr:glycosyltransferase family 2 protein [Gramella sp. KN1008]TBW25576.1 glycosyltransferase family 2 protein [Gramella sp. KN1008]